MLIYSKKYFLTWKNKNYSPIYKSMTITSPIWLNVALTNVNARLKHRFYNVVSMFCKVVSTLCNVVLTLKCWLGLIECFISFSTEDMVMKFGQHNQEETRPNFNFKIHWRLLMISKARKKPMKWCFLICKIIYILKIDSILYTLGWNTNATKISLEINKRYKKCNPFSFASFNSSQFYI